MMTNSKCPHQYPLYDPTMEHDACGVGCIVNIDNRRSGTVLTMAQEMLINMTHRTGLSSDDESGDGSGVMLSIDDSFFRRKYRAEGLPTAGDYGIGNLFVSHRDEVREECLALVRDTAARLELDIVVLHELEVERSVAGRLATESMPQIFQLAVSGGRYSRAEFEFMLYYFRKSVYSQLVERSLLDDCYICSLSNKLIVYKGMLTPTQLFDFYTDINPAVSDMQISFAIVHSRYSTNTIPNWSRAHPNRMVSHNGEINTLRGNVNKMRSRDGFIKAAQHPVIQKYRLAVDAIVPTVEQNMSDSGSFDNVFEQLYHHNIPLEQVIKIMIPEAWEHNGDLSPLQRQYYEYTSTYAEPWDGPATIILSDGDKVAITVDRNGLRPCRYCITDDGLLIAASEAGTVAIDPATVSLSHSVKPGESLIVDTVAHTVLDNRKLLDDLAGRYDHRSYLQQFQYAIKPDEYTSVHAIGAAVSGAQNNDGKSSTIDDTMVVGTTNSGAHTTNGGAHTTAGGAHTTAGSALATASSEDEVTTSMGSGGQLSMSDYITQLRMFDYTYEQIQIIVKPMIEQGKDPIGSMGNDAILAVLSDRPRLLYDYFHQLFAQVTNPPIDSIREQKVMSLRTHIGPEYHPLTQQYAPSAVRVVLESPIMMPGEYQQLMAHLESAASVVSIDLWFTATDYSLEQYVKYVTEQVDAHMRDGCAYFIFSDDAVAHDAIPVSPLLLVGAVHQHLVNINQRINAVLLVKSGEPRSVHHFCMLMAYGVDAVYPYLVYHIIERMYSDNSSTVKASRHEWYANFRKAIHYGMRKVLGKMGISTIESYKGSQLFEALGIAQSVVDVCFTGTMSRIGGVTFDIIQQEAVVRMQSALRTNAHQSHADELDNPGEYQWRTNGVYHQWNPKTVSYLQVAVKNNDQTYYDKFVAAMNSSENRKASIRGILDIATVAEGGIAIDEVEAADSIVKRFATGAMSYGSISQEAHETLALAMNRIGGKSNTGEGGELPERFKPFANGDSIRSSIKQIASGRFGVSIDYLVNADEIQIKMAQGAKPGEGGELPGYKVYEVIARTRNSTPGVGLISPPPHHDIYSIEDLAQLIFDLKHANPAARISVKLVSVTGVGTIASGVAKGLSDHILISGFSGGTGASPMSSIKHAGLPWEVSLAETHQILCYNDLRDRVVLQVDGGLKSGRDVVVAAMLGAEEFGFSTAPLITMGCIMMRVCHLNTCPVGIATQNEELRKHFTGKAEHVIRYLYFVAEEVRTILARLGLRSVDEVIGRTDLLSLNDSLLNWKSQTVDLSSILHVAQPGVSAPAVQKDGVDLADDVPTTEPTQSDDMGTASAITKLAAGLPYVQKGNHNNPRYQTYKQSVDYRLISEIEDALDIRQTYRFESAVTSCDRTIGTYLSYVCSKKFDAEKPPENFITLRLTGCAGQSLGAWLHTGITIELEGETNDYVGKGLSGGKIIIYPYTNSRIHESPVVVGNVSLYGALAGSCFIRGRAANRFCVRNSGAHVVVEGIGDHGCEYMTGGSVVILGSIGKNFAAGMSGGIAYVLDVDGSNSANINQDSVDIELPEPEDTRVILEMLRQHLKYTKSPYAKQILEHFDEFQPKFLRVISPEYRHVLELRRHTVGKQELING